MASEVMPNSGPEAYLNAPALTPDGKPAPGQRQCAQAIELGDRVEALLRQAIEPACVPVQTPRAAVTELSVANLSSESVAVSTLTEPLRQHHRIAALDAVRGLAIVMVTFYRFTDRIIDGSNAQYAWASLSQLGSRGVELFFVLSGFLITGILVDAKGTPHFFRNFIARRALRIFPLYFGVLALAFIALPLFLGPTPSPFAVEQRSQAWLWTYLANVKMSLDGHWSFGSFNHFWSLSVEEHFYLLWPLVVCFCSRRRLTFICLTLIVAAPLTRCAWMLSGGNSVAAQAFTLFRLDSLAIGALLSLAVRNDQWRAVAARWAPRALVVLAVALAPLAMFQLRLMYLTDTLFALFFGALVMQAYRQGCNVQRSRRPTVWNSRVLQWFGAYSYGIYVFQSPLNALFQNIVEQAPAIASSEPSWLVPLCRLFGLTALTCMLAYVSWHAYEKHFLKLKAAFER